MEQASQVNRLSDRTALKNDEFYLQKQFLIRWNRVSLHSPSPASSVSLLGYFHKIQTEVGQRVLDLHLTWNLPGEKNMTPVNSSKHQKV